jgi:hypothetical protein
MTDKDELAALRKEVEELKAAVAPKPQKTWAEIERENAEWRDQMHQIAEKRMSLATPPSVVRDLTVLDDNLCAGIRGDARAPTGRPGMIPTQPATGDDRPAAGDGKGYSDPRPLGPQPGIHWVDAQLIADEVRQRAELKRKLGE